MIEHYKIIKVVLCLVLILAFAAACGPPETITDTITEEEFRQEEFLCQDNGLEVDFQPGKMVCSGELEGEQVVIEINAKAVDGEWSLQILRFSRDGVNLTPEEFADLSAGLAQETTITPEEGYAVTSIIITDSELTITQSLK
jgi:hypothetical protein